MINNFQMINCLIDGIKFLKVPLTITQINIDTLTMTNNLF